MEPEDIKIVKPFGLTAKVYDCHGNEIKINENCIHFISSNSMMSIPIDIDMKLERPKDSKPLKERGRLLNETDGWTIDFRDDNEVD